VRSAIEMDKYNTIHNHYDRINYYQGSCVVCLCSGKKIVLYGELTKWVTMSPNRIKEITQLQSEVLVTLQGASSEHVTFTYSVDGVMVRRECVLSAYGLATLHVVAQRC